MEGGPRRIRSWVAAQVSFSGLQRLQERYQVRFFLRRQDKPKAGFVKMRDIQQGLSRAVMEERGAGGETTQDRSLDLANIVESAIDQGFAEICRGRALSRRGTCCRNSFALLEGGQIADLHSTRVYARGTTCRTTLP